MFGLRRKKEKNNNHYSSIRLLYFNQPVDETVSVEINRGDKTFELLWGTNLYVMPMSRLSVSYYHDLYASLLAQGRQCFAGDWPIMQKLLLREQEYRGQKNALKNCDGLKIVCETKEGGSLLCVLTSEVFFCMTELYKALNSYVDEKKYTKVEI